MKAMYNKEEQLRKSYEKKLEKARQKPLSQLKKSLQKRVNAWIRQRDELEPCISCQKRCEKGEAGHFIAQGSSGALRFNTDNIHKQCTACNHFRRGNLLEYRINLIKKIGKEKVEWLEEHRKDVKKWTREELEALLEEYCGKKED